MGNLVTWAADNIYRPHRYVVGRLQDRFPGLPLETDRRGGWVALRPPTEAERDLVHEALACFAPWTPCSQDPGPPGAIWDHLFAEQATSEREEREQIHVLLDPKCAGLARLICDYNQTFGDHSDMPIDPPENKLGIPYLTPPSSSGGGPRTPHRFQPPPLSRYDLDRLNHIVSHRRERRRRIRPEWLSVAVDGREVVRYLTQDQPSHEMSLPHHASYLQVYGHDADGPILLAIVPLAEEAVRMEIPTAAQPLILTLQPQWTATGDLEQYRLWLSYDLAHDRARAPGFERVVRWISELWHPPLAGEPITAAASRTQSHTFYLEKGKIRVTCTWWAAAPGYPAALRLAWQADLALRGELWARFTQPNDATAVLSEVPLGRDVAGQEVFATQDLGFDPTGEPWALTLVLREPEP
jgi:hypothetical protein